MNPTLPPSQNFSRRAFLRALGGVSFLGLAGLGFAGCESLFTYPENGFRSPGLASLAARRGKFYGAAIQSSQLNDPGFVHALRQEVNLLVPENELKWAVLRPSPDSFDFSGYQRIANFARDNGMALRGHTLVWHYANPEWLEPALANKKTAETVLRTHIARVITETSPFIRSWDVVNEAVSPRSPRADGLRETLWLKALGPGYIPYAFYCAHEADPGLTLVYNDFGLEYGDGYGHAKRVTLLRLLEECRKDGMPVHALGLQSHLQCGRLLAGPEFAGFLKEVRGLGLAVYVTELDLDLTRLSGRADDKIRFGQNYVRAYLDIIQESGALDTLLTWGLSDRYTWMRQGSPDATGVLPLDVSMDRMPLWDTLRSRWAES